MLLWDVSCSERELVLLAVCHSQCALHIHQLPHFIFFFFSNLLVLEWFGILGMNKTHCMLPVLSPAGWYFLLTKDTGLLKKRKGAQKKKATPCFQDASVTNRFSHRNLPASSFPVSLCVVLCTQLAEELFLGLLFFFAERRVHGARTNSRIWGNGKAVCYKANLYYSQILVRSHEAWGVSPVPGKQTRVAAASLPPSSSSQTAGVGGQEARVSSQTMLPSYHWCPK